MAALKSLKVPKIEFDSDLEKITVCQGELVPFDLRKTVTSCSYSLFDLETTELLSDPTFEEEDKADSQITLVISDSGEICLTDQSGGLAMSQEILQKAISLATSQSK